MTLLINIAKCAKCSNTLAVKCSFLKFSTLLSSIYFYSHDVEKNKQVKLYVI